MSLLQKANHQRVFESIDESIMEVSSALRDHLDSDDALAAFCSSSTIRRYLAARNRNIEAATDMLRCDACL